MASLKEVKARIASVNSTLKITSAMKMVASAKLHRAQAAIENMLPYERKLHEILEGFLSSEGAVASAYAEKHDAVERVAVVAVSSNSSLCGAFNANVARKLGETLTEYRSLGKERVLVFPIGKKIAEAVRKAGYVPQGDYQSLAERPTYREASQLAERLMRMYAEREIDRVELVYNHFKSTASQVLRREEYLPLQVEPARDERGGRRLHRRAVARGGDPDAGPAGAESEDIHDAARLERCRARRADDRDADGYR